MEKIGFVGTGAMGSALLSRLKLANVPATGQPGGRAQGRRGDRCFSQSGGANLDDD